VCHVTIVLFYLLLCSQVVGGGGWHTSFANAAVMTTRKSETPTTYWETLLPRTPMPPAVSDLLAERNGLPLSPSLYIVTFLFSLKKIY
jgi:uncharacterized membrane-anchored protein